MIGFGWKILGILALLAVLSVSFARAADATYHPVDSKKVLPLINAGWGPTFKDLQPKLNPEKNYITWAIEFPAIAYDFRSAEYFRRSIIGGPQNTEAISHMMIAWQCHDSDGKLFRGATGFTGENSKQTMALLEEGWGLTSFFATFTDGELNTPEDIEEYFTDAAKENHPVAHITVEVSAESCQKAQAFIKSFIDHPNKPGTKFGANLRPLKFEGAGCGTFASAVLTHAGVMPSLQPLMWRTVRASKYLMGWGQDLPPKTRMKLPGDIELPERWVWMGRMQMEPWMAEDGPALSVVDPEMGLLAMRTIAHASLKQVGASAKTLIGTGFAPREITSTRWGTSGGSSGPMHTEKFQITRSLDPHAASVARAAMKELEALKAQGMSVKTSKVGGFWGLMISRD